MLSSGSLIRWAELLHEHPFVTPTHAIAVSLSACVSRCLCAKACLPMFVHVCPSVYSWTSASLSAVCSCVWASVRVSQCYECVALNWSMSVENYLFGRSATCLLLFNLRFLGFVCSYRCLLLSSVCFSGSVCPYSVCACACLCLSLTGLYVMQIFVFVYLCQLNSNRFAFYNESVVSMPLNLPARSRIFASKTVC